MRGPATPEADSRGDCAIRPPTRADGEPLNLEARNDPAVVHIDDNQHSRLRIQAPGDARQGQHPDSPVSGIEGDSAQRTTSLMSTRVLSLPIRRSRL